MPRGNRNLNDYTGILATMVAIFIVGVVMDAAVFGQLDRYVRRRHGLIDSAT